MEVVGLCQSVLNNKSYEILDGNTALESENQEGNDSEEVPANNSIPSSHSKAFMSWYKSNQKVIKFSSYNLTE